jgi:hypothetical protein
MKIDVYSDMSSAFKVQLKDGDISTRKYEYNGINLFFVDRAS